MSETIINLNNVNIYQKDKLVLGNVDFKVERKELVYVVGKVGSGKSSLLKVIYADLPLEEGEAEVAGFILKNLKKKQIPMLRRNIGIVFQDFQLLTDRTVYDNLLFVLNATGWKSKKGMHGRIMDVLNDVGLTDKAKKMPNQLSGGEQQRVVIARALLNEPPIILADEPTGNLDPETSENILKLLTSIAGNECTLVVATHDYEIMKKFPGRTYICEDSKLTESAGRMEEIDFTELD